MKKRRYAGFCVIVLICFKGYFSWAQAPASLNGLTFDLTITAAGGGNNGSGSYTIAFSPSLYTLVYNGQTKTGSYTYSVLNPSTGLALATVGSHINDIYFYFTDPNGGTYSSTNTLGQYEDGIFTVDCRSIDPLFFSKSIAVELLPNPMSGPAIQITFTPANGCSLSDVAQAFGFHHFNWLQIAVEYPGSFFTWGLTPPFIDPPLGGYPCNFGNDCDFADNLPFYWDEGVDSRFSTDRVLSTYTQANRLSFLDAPKNPHLQPGQKMSFVTCLVGVRSDNSYSPLYTLTWSSTWSGDDGGISTRNPIVPNQLTNTTGGIIEVQQNTAIEQLPVEVLRLLVENGASDIPLLSISHEATGLLVSWPSDVLGFTLQTSTNALAGLWSDITTQSNRFMLQPDNGVRFYRLIKK